jgi:hypothetical protein
LGRGKTKVARATFFCSVRTISALCPTWSPGDGAVARAEPQPVQAWMDVHGCLLRCEVTHPSEGRRTGRGCEWRLSTGTQMAEMADSKAQRRVVHTISGGMIGPDPTQRSAVQEESQSGHSTAKTSASMEPEDPSGS